MKLTNRQVDLIVDIIVKKIEPKLKKQIETENKKNKEKFEI